MKTLIVYASKNGTVEKCAAMLSHRLLDKADIFEVKKAVAQDISQYETIIIGGSIYMGKIQKELSEFCRQNTGLLKNKKLGLYICSLMKDENNSQLNAAFPQELLDIAAAKGNFGGEMNFSNMNFATRALLKMFIKAIEKDDKRFSGIDGKKDVSFLANENIDRFARQMDTVSAID